MPVAVRSFRYGAAMQEATNVPTSASVTPGWYQDPVTPGQIRWYDGQRWTDQVAAAPLPPPVAPADAGGEQGPPGYSAPGYGSAAHPGTGYGTPGYDSPGYTTPGYGTTSSSGPSDVTHWLLPVGRSWQSIVAGYLGLVSTLVFFLAPFSIGLGIWALRKARTGGHGRGRAWLGIVGGLIGIAFGVWILTR